MPGKNDVAAVTENDAIILCNITCITISITIQLFCDISTLQYIT